MISKHGAKDDDGREDKRITIFDIFVLTESEKKSPESILSKTVLVLTS
jgi:hypothetical protein